MNTTSASSNSMVKLALFGLTVLAAIWVALDALIYMEKAWGSDEYSHSYLIPVISLLLILQKWPSVEHLCRTSWLGVPIILAGVFVAMMGQLSTLFTISQYGFLIMFVGAFTSAFGLRVTLKLWAPLLYLFFMIPLPSFVFNNLSNSLQLISSEIGVAVIRAFGISVFLAGNVIDLGVMKLQVVEACSGLRYLFPLSSFGFLVAYLFQAPLWQRAILFLSTIPITVLMNSFRIGVIGVLVEYWGPGQAEGFLHMFEGWIIFIACLGVLALEMWIFHKLSKQPGSMLDRLDLSFPEMSQIKLPEGYSRLTLLPLAVALVTVGSAAAYSSSVDSRPEDIPSRATFLQFPLFHEGWLGRESTLDADVLSTLRLTDHVIADYTHADYELPVNFYIAYYDSQRSGASVHSPRSCIPGDGWEIQTLEQVNVELQQSLAQPLQVNRVMIQKGQNRQLVYYWFKQRDRVLTNEYLVKWYLFWDSLTRNRTDGSLVRVVIPVPEGYSVDGADQQLARFLVDFYPTLNSYLPD